MNTENDSLHLVCPPPMRYIMLVIATLALAMLAGIMMQSAKDIFSLKFSAIGTSIFSAVMFLFFGCIVWRNVYFRDQMFILKEGATAPENIPSVYLKDIIAIRLQAPPNPYSPEGKMEFMGLGNGRIIIETPAGILHFGAGLTSGDAQKMIGRIENFRSS